MALHADSLKELMGINYRNLDIIQPQNPRRFFPQVDDKIKTKELLIAGNTPVPEMVGFIDSFLKLEEMWEQLREHENLVIKPSKGRAGGGILVLKKDAHDRFATPSGRHVEDDEILRHMGDILFGVYSFGSPDDRVLIEELVLPHPFFIEIFDRGVADVRIILLKGVPVMAMLRVPTNESDGKANLHQGAIGIGVGLENGRLQLGARNGKPISCHPDSGVEFVDRQLPFWREIVDIAVRSTTQVNLGYLGVDIVIDARYGPLVLELNARPGLEIQAVNGKGMLSAIGAAEEAGI